MRRCSAHRLSPTRHTGVIGTDAWVPAYHLAKAVGIYDGTTPGAGMHYAAGYRRPMVPGLNFTTTHVPVQSGVIPRTSTRCWMSA
jgi:hypothetical protein